MTVPAVSVCDARTNMCWVRANYYMSVELLDQYVGVVTARCLFCSSDWTGFASSVQTRHFLLHWSPVLRGGSRVLMCFDSTIAGRLQGRVLQQGNAFGCEMRTGNQR